VPVARARDPVEPARVPVEPSLGTRSREGALVLELAERLRRVAACHDTTPGAVAVAWTLRNPAVNGAIVGFRRPEQVDPIVAAANLTLDKQDIATILRRK
jgi:aryl-alcohol dehydrogenase-like predicted oxidoreductase